jgi:hypothetical protein
VAIKGQNIPESSNPDVQLLTAKAYRTDLANHETTYKHANIHAPGSDAETVTSVGALVLGATEKTAPVDTDMLSLMDTEDSNKIKKFSWSNIKARFREASIASSISGGDTTHCPDGNSVFDALALKQGKNTEGTWTPTAAGLTVVGGTAILSGKYTKIGNVVYYTITVTPSNPGTTTIAATSASFTLPSTPVSITGATFINSTLDVRGDGYVFTDGKVYITNWAVSVRYFYITGFYFL